MKKIIPAFVLIITFLNSNAQCWNRIILGAEQAFASKTDNIFWVWGKNDSGELGIGTLGLKNVPTQQPALINWQNVTIGYIHALALKTDGSLWSWGDNQSGQLGIGTYINKLSPVQIGTATDWQSVSTKSYSCLAIKTNGSLWAWGDNSTGQLGGLIGSSINVPTQIGTAYDWRLVAADYNHSMAIKTDGTLWGWGGINNNNYGQIGNNTTDPVYYPAQIGTDNNWQDIALGMYFTLALKTNGSLWAWGRNDYGQLGDGTTTDRLIPAQVGTDTNWESIAADLSFSAAIKTDGTLWTWGSNTFGELGNGTATPNVANPDVSQVGSDTDWEKVATGQHHIAAIKNDGRMWIWGLNDSGQLGMGVTGASQNLHVPTELTCQQLSMAELESSAAFTIYPNPAGNMIYIELKNQIIDSIIISDISGRKILEYEEYIPQIDIHQLQNGVYLLHVSSGKGSYSKKFIKT